MPTPASPGSNSPGEPGLVFYGVAAAVETPLLETGIGDLTRLPLSREPFFTGADLVAYFDCDDSGYPYHRMRLRSAAVARVPRTPSPVGTPFVVTVGEERLFLGVFLREQAGCSNRVPTILIDPERADGLPDWYWIARSRPDRLHPGPDPRADPRFQGALRASDMIRPLDHETWRQPLAGPPQPADGASGIRLRLAGADLLDHLRGGGRAAFPVLRGLATRVDMPQPAAGADLTGAFRCRLPVAPGVYQVQVRIAWRSHDAPPRVAPTIVEVLAGRWVEVVLGG